LLFTGCRLREILLLKWEHVDLERGLLFLPESKTGRKTIILNAASLAVLSELKRLGSYVIPGDDVERPRADLKRPWEASPDVLAWRCSPARSPPRSVLGAGGGWNCRSSASSSSIRGGTTQRYAHLDNDPAPRCQSIGGRIKAAMDGKASANVVAMKTRRRAV
jgi:hypothetical protein